jgi:hypothetical protein
MKYILLRGASHAGKSTTMDAICKALKPDRIQRFNPHHKIITNISEHESVHNGSFILHVKGVIILVAAGATTEQGFTITMLLKIAFELDIRIDFALVSMRSYEKKDDFDTPEELKLLGECIYDERIRKIPGDDFKERKIWKKRISDILGALEKSNVIIPDGVNEMAA